MDILHRRRLVEKPPWHGLVGGEQPAHLRQQGMILTTCFNQERLTIHQIALHGSSQQKRGTFVPKSRNHPFHPFMRKATPDGIIES
jgi:hypothetical protein